MYTINIIGAGRVGCTLGALLYKKKVARILGVVNQSYSSTERAVKFLGCAKICLHIRDLPPADILLITTKDDDIKRCAQIYAQCLSGRTKGIALHCSGVLPSSVLDPLAKKGFSVASFHPLKTFFEPSKSADFFLGTYCSLEGDKDILKAVAEIFSKIGAKIFTIKANDKLIYHAAATFSSNYLFTLYKEAFTMLETLALPKEVIKNILVGLMESSLEALKDSAQLSSHLTGPMQRGDINTLKKHLQVLGEKGYDELYRILGVATLDITTHSQEVRENIKSIFHKKMKK